MEIYCVIDSTYDKPKKKRVGKKLHTNIFTGDYGLALNSVCYLSIILKLQM